LKKVLYGKNFATQFLQASKAIHPTAFTTPPFFTRKQL